MAAPPRGYRDLRVWQRGMDLVGAVYRLTAEFPRDEQFGLTSQIRRAAASIPANVAEGHGRGTRPAYAAFVRIARGSLRELETHLLIASRVGLAEMTAVDALLERTDEIGRMLTTLVNRLASAPAPRPPFLVPPSP